MQESVTPNITLKQMIANLRVVVAIPTLNEAGTIETVVKTLALEREFIPNLKIVVSDGGSQDGTIDIVNQMVSENPFIELIYNPQRFQSSAVNMVANSNQYHFDILVRCDAHSSYPPRFIQRLCEVLLLTGADSIVVPMDSSGKNCIERAIAWVSDTPIGSGGAAHRAGTRSGFVDHGHHAAFKIPIFLKLGGYEKSFTHNEDAEFDCRLTATGGKIFLDAENRISYTPRKSLSALARQYFNYGIGRSRTVRRHPKSMRLRQLAVPAQLIFSIISIALFFVSHQIILLGWPIFYISALLLASGSLALRHKSICGLFTGLAALVMHSAWGVGFLLGFIIKREAVWHP